MYGPKISVLKPWEEGGKSDSGKGQRVSRGTLLDDERAQKKRKKWEVQISSLKTDSLERYGEPVDGKTQRPIP